MLFMTPMTTHDPVDKALEALGPLRGTIVIVGGAILHRYLDGPTTPPTNGVVEVVCRVEGEAFEAKLKARGFLKDPSAQTLRRWVKGDVKLDVVPSSFVMPGISNPWYTSALAYAKKIELGNGWVEMIDAVHLLAAQLQWLRDWGIADARSGAALSIVTNLIERRASLANEFKLVPLDVVEFIARTLADFESLLPKTSGATEAFPEHLARVRQMAHGLLE